MSLYKQKLNNYNPEHITRMKYLHLDIYFGLHMINLVLSFLQFSAATNSLPGSGVFNPVHAVMPILVVSI